MENTESKRLSDEQLDQIALYLDGQVTLYPQVSARYIKALIAEVRSSRSLIGKRWQAGECGHTWDPTVHADRCPTCAADRYVETLRAELQAKECRITAMRIERGINETAIRRLEESVERLQAEVRREALT